MERKYRRGGTTKTVLRYQPPVMQNTRRTDYAPNSTQREFSVAGLNQKTLEKIGAGEGD